MSYQKLADYLTYDPKTGAFTWAKQYGRRCYPGAAAGSPDSRGYIVIVFQGKRYAGHRLAWLMATGEPASGMLDHRNLDPSDNRFENLRLATPTQNNANVRGRGAYAKGVTLHRRGRFQAQIKKGGRNYYLGLYDTVAEASAAYAAKAEELFGQFARAA